MQWTGRQRPSALTIMAVKMRGLTISCWMQPTIIRLLSDCLIAMTLAEAKVTHVKSKSIVWPTTGLQNYKITARRCHLGRGSVSFGLAASTALGCPPLQLSGHFAYSSPPAAKCSCCDAHLLRLLSAHKPRVDLVVQLQALWISRGTQAQRDFLLLHDESRGVCHARRMAEATFSYASRQ